MKVRSKYANLANAKLDADKAAEIRRRYWGKCDKRKQLAQEFGVHLTTIDRIVNQQSWV